MHSVNTGSKNRGIPQALLTPPSHVVLSTYSISELSVVHQDDSDGERVKVLLHGAHITRRGGGEDLVYR